MASENDFYEMVNFFESAKRVNLNQFPIRGLQSERIIVPRYIPKTGDNLGVDSAVDFDADIHYSL
jgi:hypothetical protein